MLVRIPSSTPQEPMVSPSEKVLGSLIRACAALHGVPDGAIRLTYFHGGGGGGGEPSACAIPWKLTLAIDCADWQLRAEARTLATCVRMVVAGLIDEQPKKAWALYGLRAELDRLAAIERESH